MDEKKPRSRPVVAEARRPGGIQSVRKDPDRGLCDSSRAIFGTAPVIS
jgi:hypothetical protein